MPIPDGPGRVELDAAAMRELLTELGSRLAARGVRAELYLVGGAAIALTYDVRRVTVDIDAIFLPREVVAEEAAALAADRGLPADWLNDRARIFAPALEPPEDTVLDVPGLHVGVAPLRQLIAMKMAAAREQDLADLAVLFEAAGVRTPEEAADIAVEVYGEESVHLTPREDLVLIARAVLAAPR